MSVFGFRHLSVKIITFMVVSGALVLGAYLLLFVQLETNRNKKEILETGLVFSELSASVLYQDYLTSSAQGYPRFEDLVSGWLEKNRNIKSVMMVSTNGKVIFDSLNFSQGTNYGRSGLGSDKYVKDKKTLELLTKQEVNHRQILMGNEIVEEVVVPIKELGGGNVFSMRYILSYKSAEDLRRQIYFEAVVTLAPLFIVLVISAFLLAYSITKPIVLLSKATEKIRKGDLSVRVPVTSRDEIGDLTLTFNDTIAALFTAQSKLKQYSEDLETQVSHRTDELKQKIDELDRINNLMVGRELTMIELKRQIAELQKAHE